MTVDEAEVAAARSRRRRFWTRPNYLGLVFAALAFQWSLTPSLLPRAVALRGHDRRHRRRDRLRPRLLPLVARSARPRCRERGPVFKHRAWIALAVLGPIYVVVSLLLGVGWQNEVRTLVGMADEGLATALEVAVVAVPVAIGCWLFGRVLRRFNGWIARTLDRWIPRTGRVGRARSSSSASIIYFAVTGVIFNAFVATMNNIYEGTNASTKDGIEQPASALRSGSRPSFSAWDTLGMEGRNFVARGPNPTRDLELHRQAGAAADPRLRRPRRRRHRSGPREDRGAGAAAHRRVQPQDPRRRGHDRHRLARAAVDGHDRVRVERRQRDRRHPVLVPAELDLHPGRRRRRRRTPARRSSTPSTRSGSSCPRASGRSSSPTASRSGRSRSRARSPTPPT